jgi:solute:Na+ symporter, SSS family
LENSYNQLYAKKQIVVNGLVKGIQSHDEKLKEVSKAEYQVIKEEENRIRKEVKTKIAAGIKGAKTQDRDYIFLNFVLHYLPHGIIGLLLAVMFSAAMSSMASELNSLASTTTVDIYKRSFKPEASERHYLNASKYFTVLWALIAMVFASLANFAENLIQFVNIVGSLFYGTILGIFLVAFYLKKVKSNAVFMAALIAEAAVLACYFYFYEEIAFLYYNIIGCVIVVALALVFQVFDKKESV